MERNIGNPSSHRHRVHPSAVLIKMLVNTINSQPGLAIETTAVANLAENIVEYNIISSPHRLSSYGYSLIKEVKIETVEDCAICKDAIEILALELPCNHKFHKDCIETWFLSRSSCPNCRKNIDYY
ncbi:hypothetical protein SteCoe_20424 [Stentor coeruleus]|uniref:RING-type domain-containing protein n=1 Tax=Stentor coeruleus TaxID=5963 RepID=A0A1R2BRS4_9CILI|nr:hypothetical protein SteCoe_20424 [Stentor coeruleus]